MFPGVYRFLYSIKSADISFHVICAGSSRNKWDCVFFDEDESSISFLASLGWQGIPKSSIEFVVVLIHIYASNVHDFYPLNKIVKNITTIGDRTMTIPQCWKFPTSRYL